MCVGFYPFAESDDSFFGDVSCCTVFFCVKETSFSVLWIEVSEEPVGLLYRIGSRRQPVVAKPPPEVCGRCSLPILGCVRIDIGDPLRDFPSCDGHAWRGASSAHSGPVNIFLISGDIYAVNACCVMAHVIIPKMIPTTMPIQKATNMSMS